MSDEQDDERPYEVGYAKPPKHTQFKKGQSGNPGGRRTGSKNLRTELEEVLKERIRITRDGKTQKVTRQRAMLMSNANNACKGDVRAFRTFVDLIFRAYGLEEETSDNDVELAADDAEILAEYVARKAPPASDGGDDA